VKFFHNKNNPILFNYLVSYSSSVFITQDSLVIHFVKALFGTIAGISEKFSHIAKNGSSLVVNDARGVFLSDKQRGRSHLALSLAWAIRCMRHSLGFGAFNHF
jgi:hypothetical protein